MPGMKSNKVILDTNLWISFLITKDYSFIDKYVENDKVKLVFSDELVQEFLTVATRPKFQKYFAVKDIEKLLRIFDDFGVSTKVTSEIGKTSLKKPTFNVSFNF